MDHYRKRFLTQQEKKDQRKARRYSMLMLLLLLIAIWLPLVVTSVKQDEPINKAILVTFEDNVEFVQDKSSSKKSSEKQAPAEEPVETPAEPEPAPAPPPVVEIPPQEVREVRDIAPISKIEAPTRNVSLTSPSREIAFAPMLQDISSTAQVEEVSEEVVEVTEEVSADVMKEFAEFFNENSSGRASSTNGTGAPTGDTGNSATPGEGDSGRSETGDANSDGKGNTGDDGFEFDGDGLLTRKVIKRANLSNIIKQTGKIVVNLCVNRDGQVIFTKADPARSTLKEKGLLRLAELAAEKYRYEKDYTVAETQCGKLSFVVKIDD